MNNLKGKVLERYLQQRHISLEELVAGVIENVSVLETAKERGMGREGGFDPLKLLRGDSKRKDREYAIQASRNWQAELRSVAERLRVREPTRKNGACIVYGRVANKWGRGISGLAVIASDKRGATLDRTQSGKHGFFRLEFGNVNRQRRGAERRRAGRAPLGGRGSVGATYVVSLQVMSESGETMYRDAVADAVVEGNVTYREILVRSAHD